MRLDKADIILFSHCFLTALCSGLLSTAGVVIESFSAPMDHNGDLWYCVGVSSLLPDLSTLKPLVENAAQLSI